MGWIEPVPNQPTAKDSGAHREIAGTPRVKKSLGLFYMGVIYMRYSHSIVPTGFGVRS